MKKEKIRWSNEERDMLADEVAAAMFINRELELIPALRKAQEKLPANRRRKLSTLAASQVNWLDVLVNHRLVALAKEEKELQERLAKEKEKEAEVGPTLENVETPELLAELLKRIIPMIARELAPIVRDAVFESHAYEKETVQAPKKPKLKSVLVIGLLPKQANEIERALKGMLDLRFHKGDNPSAIKSAAASVDLVIAHTDHLSHSAEASARASASHYTRVTGGLTKMKDALETYYLETAEE